MDKTDPKIIDLSAALEEKMKEGEKRTARRIPVQIGIHDGVPRWDYHAWDAYGSGDIRQMGRSPDHFRAAYDSADVMNAQMRTGSALHACVLEPDTEWKRYVRLPDGKDRRSKEYKVLIDEEDYDPDFVLRDKEYDSCLGGRDALFAHSRISKLLAEGRPEVSFGWEDHETGILLKGRSDWLAEGIATTIDLKQTTDAREPAFRKVAKSMGYPVQGAHYVTGLRHHDIPIKHYADIAVEVDPPYGVMLYRISTKDMLVAEAHWRALVDKLAWCKERSFWPGYPEHTRVLHMGMWWETGVQEEIAWLEESMK